MSKNMKWILLVAQVDLADKTSGVSQKIIAQKEALNGCANEVHCYCYYNGKIALVKPDKIVFFKSPKKLVRRFAFWKALRNVIRAYDYSLVYIRYSYIDYYVKNSLQSIKSTSSTIVLEIPTFPLTKEKLTGTEKLLYCLEKVFIHNVGHYIDRVLYIGDKTDRIFGLKAKQIPNGVPFSIRSVEKTGFNFDGKNIRIIGVSIMAPSHGYDRLIKGLYSYYQNKSESMPSIELVLVGDGACKNEYVTLSELLHLQDSIIFTGFLEGEELNKIYRTATVGAGCFGLYRNGHTESSTLKIKEYLIRGLPFINASQEISIPNDFKYQLLFDNNDSEIDFNRIVEFVYKMNSIGRETILDEMESFAIHDLSWNAIMKNAIGDLL